MTGRWRRRRAVDEAPLNYNRSVEPSFVRTRLRLRCSGRANSPRCDIRPAAAAAGRRVGITAHGQRHEALIEEYIAITGQEPPLRGGGEGLTREQEDAARLAVSRLAGHNRGRASAAYLGAVLHRKKGGAKGGAPGGDAAA